MADIKKYEEYYSNESFMDKVSRCAAMAGREVLLKAFQLYYVLGKPDVPVWAKGTIMGAIGYFILPGGRMRVRFYLQASLGPDGIRRK